MSTILELFIPIIAVSTLPIIVYFIVKKKMHDRKLLSKEILAAIKKGIDVLYASAINGYTGELGMMPAKGGNPALSDEEVKAAVDYIINQVQ